MAQKIVVTTNIVVALAKLVSLRIAFPPSNWPPERWSGNSTWVGYSGWATPLVSWITPWRFSIRAAARMASRRIHTRVVPSGRVGLLWLATYLLTLLHVSQVCCICTRPLMTLLRASQAGSRFPPQRKNPGREAVPGFHLRPARIRASAGRSPSGNSCPRGPVPSTAQKTRAPATGAHALDALGSWGAGAVPLDNSPRPQLVSFMLSVQGQRHSSGDGAGGSPGPSSHLCAGRGNLPQTSPSPDEIVELVCSPKATLNPSKLGFFINAGGTRHDYSFMWGLALV